VRRALVLLIAVASLAAPAAAAAQCPRTSVADIEDEVMCPVCGTPLALATEAPQAKQERSFILDLVEQCKSKDEVKTALVAEFGESVLAVPGDDGFDRAAVLVPGLGLLLALAGITVATVRWRRGPPGGGGDGEAPAAAALGGSDNARLDADLKRYDL